VFHHERELLEGRDDDLRLFTRECFGELFGVLIDAFDHALGVLEL
jgi:hypothetical protein